MSRIRANKITNKLGTGAVELEKGAHLPIGMGITGAGGLNITGVVTASSFVGSGAALTGIDATAIKDSGGNVKIQAQASGAVHTGISTFQDIDVDGHTNLDNISVSGVSTFTGNVSIGGTLTYEDVTNIDSVGLITARKGIVSSGVVTATAFDGGIKVVAANSVAATVYPVFAGSGATQSGNLDLKTDNSLTYNSLSGELTAVKFTGDGSGLTGVDVGLTTEALVKTNGQTALLNLSKDDHKVTATGTVTINVTGGSEGASHSLRIENSGTANVGFSTYFKFPSGATPSFPSTGGAISLISFTVHKAGSTGIATVLLAGASVNFS